MDKLWITDVVQFPLRLFLIIARAPGLLLATTTAETPGPQGDNLFD
jgi:hypothetical protein